MTSPARRRPAGARVRIAARGGTAATADVADRPCRIDHADPAGDGACDRGCDRVCDRVCDRACDHGTVTAFTVILTTALIACAGLVLDGGLALTAKVQAIDVAQEAARAGAQELDLTLYRSSGALALNPDAAVQAARAYLTTAGATGTVSATGDAVTVTADLDRPTQLLGLIGIGSLHVSGHATARAVPVT